jgi:drug efflux transport system ATP-binding protein
MDTVITTRALAKTYSPGTATEVRALDGLEFEVRAGEIFGLIGADGAGKTTTFKIIAGVLEPGSGEIRVLGARPRESRDQVGYVTQPFSLYLDLSVLENLQYAAGLREMPEQEFAERRSYYLKLFDMDRFESRLAGQLSGGMKQKLALTCALIFRPKILLLDEPTTGVDPVSRRDFWDALTSLASEGMTIVVATPYFDEAERCHRIALMEAGKIFQIDTPARFRSQLGLTRLGVFTSQLARAEAVLSTPELLDRGVGDVQRFGDRLEVLVPSAEEGERLVKERLQRDGLEVQRFRRSSPTLESAFVATLRRMRGRETSPAFPERSRGHEETRDSDEVAIGAYSLNKRFGSFQAVKDFSVEIPYGEIYGLLGANGAGKTTAIKMICGLLRPTSGEFSLLGRRTNLRSAEARSQIGYMSQKFTLYDDLTIGENLDFYASLYGVPAQLRRRRKDWVLEISGLGGQADLLTRQLPGGWKQRVAFGAAVMHEPRVIFLDEPTSGVDPLARRVMWRMINELADQGAAILVVTHYLEEAEQCNRLGFMVAGEIIAQGSPSEIKSQMQDHLIEVELQSGAVEHAMRELRQRYGARRVSRFGNQLHLTVSPETAADDVLRSLAEKHIAVKQAAEVEFSLEDVFISLIEDRRQEIPQ